jgi:hypothetical protein
MITRVRRNYCKHELILKACEIMLKNIINSGTYCPSFESEIIVNNAKAVFIGEHSETLALNPEQSQRSFSC